MKIDLNNYLKERLQNEEEITLIPIDKIKIIFLHDNVKVVVSESLHQGTHYIINEDFEEEIIINSDKFIKFTVKDYEDHEEQLIYVNKKHIEEIFEEIESRDFYYIKDENSEDMFYIHKEDFKKPFIKNNINNF